MFNSGDAGCETANEGGENQSFSFVDAKRILSKRGTGFWVECLPKRFSGRLSRRFSFFAAQRIVSAECNPRDIRRHQLLRCGI